MQICIFLLVTSLTGIEMFGTFSTSTSDWVDQIFLTLQEDATLNISKMLTEVRIKTFKHLAAINNALVQKLSDFSGLEPSVVSNFVQFAKCMAKPKTDDVDEPIFMAVMLKWFGILEKPIICKMFAAIKRSLSKNATVEEMSRLLCVFYSIISDRKTDFIFHVYDINGDGLLDMVELTLWLKESAVVMEEEADTFDPIQDLIQITADSLGISHDNPINLDMFRFMSVIQGKSQMEIKRAFGKIREKLLFDHPDPLDKSLYPVLLDLP